MEYDAFGFYLSDHPSKFYKSLSYEKDLFDIVKLNEYEENHLNENKSFKCICLISELKERKSKTGKRFCFFSLSDETGILDTICFSEVLDSLNSDLKVGNIVFVKVFLQQIRDTKKFVINSIKVLDESKNNKNYLISLDTNSLNFEKFQNILNKSEVGNCNFNFRMNYSQYEIKIKSKTKYLVSMDLLHDLKNTEGILDIQEIN